MFKCYNRGEVRVSQLAGAVAQYCCYHHGEVWDMRVAALFFKGFVYFFSLSESFRCYEHLPGLEVTRGNYCEVRSKFCWSK